MSDYTVDMLATQRGQVLWLHWLVSIRPLVTVLLTEVFKQCGGFGCNDPSFKSGVSTKRPRAGFERSHFSANAR